MILREPLYSDREWMTKAYSDWPNEKEYVTAEKVHNYLRRWIERKDVECRVGVIDQPVGLITFKQEFFGGWIYNVVIRPHLRNNGYFTELARLLKDELVSRGTIVVGFKTLPGPLENKYPGNIVTWDQEI